jgi:phage-related protein
VGNIANYNLGSVQGEVRITYDRRGITEAEADLADLGATSSRSSREVDEVGNASRRSAGGVAEFGSKVRDSESAVKSLSTVMKTLAKPLFLGGAAQSAIGFTQAITPILGLTAVLPGVLGVVGAAAAAVMIGTKGMGDAFTAVAEGDAKALQEAMAKLAPSAQEIVTSYSRMRPAIEGLKLSVQNALFNDLADMSDSLGKTYLPVLNTGLTTVATSLNKMIYLSAQALLDPQVVASLGVLLGNAAATTDQFGGALGDVLGAFINIAAVGSDWLPLWTNGASDAAAAFREWSGSAAGQAQINAWIQQGADTLGKLVQILGNLGSIASGVFNAMETGSGGMLENLIALTGQMAAWVNSAEGQATLVPIFKLMHQVFLATLDAVTLIVGIIGALARAYGSLSPEAQSVVASFIAWGGVLGFIIGKLTPLIGFVAALVTHWGTIVKVGAAVVNTFMSIMRVFRALSLLMMTNPWVLLAVAVVAIAVLIYQNWDAIVAFLTQVWTTISTTAITVWNGILNFFTTLWNGILTIATTVWTGIVNFFTTIWNSISAPVMATWNGIVAFLSAVWEVVFTIMRYAAAILLAIFFTIWNPLSALVITVWNGIVNFLTTVWNGIVALATTVWNAVSGAIMAVWNAIVAFLTPIIQMIASAIETSWNFISGVASSVWNAILSVIQTVWNTIWGFLSPILQTIGDGIATAWNAISSVISTVMNAVWGVISSVWNNIVSFFTGVWNTISNAFSSGTSDVMNQLNSLWNTITGLAGTAINLLVSAGKNIVTGLWNGIVSMGTWLWNAIMNWIKSVVPGPILQFLGIASPSKWMEKEVGENLPPGIAKGVKNETKVATDASSGLAKDVAKAATVTLPAPTVNVGQLPPATVQQMNSLALSTGATTGGTPAASQAVATAAQAAPVSTGPKIINIGTFAISVEGNLDPTDPVKWRAAMEKIRDGLTSVEASYR